MNLKNVYAVIPWAVGIAVADRRHLKNPPSLRRVKVDGD